MIKRVQNDTSQASDSRLLSRDVVFSNTFSGSRLLSSIELARGYSSALLGVPKKLISYDLIDAYNDQSKIRALHWLIKAGDPQILSADCLPAVQEVLFSFKTSHKKCSCRMEIRNYGERKAPFCHGRNTERKNP